MKIIIKVFFWLLLLVVSCKSVESNNVEVSSKNSTNIVEQLAQNKFGNNYILQYNRTKDYVICVSTPKSKIPNTSSTSYFVYNVLDSSIVEEKIIRSGTISWFSDYEIKVIEIPGMIKKNVDNEHGYIFNLKTNSKTKLNGGVN
ncbi:MAG: hypothetical protein KKF62_00360 [Bacteroidetes bacterium]|nr:hypothetical protein [Bacteroidota bacterium]MBU1114592.1 hypothetical protein [Bacteroidota bacterium]MBU1799630.1 hypothetical protein [Bacteroidota bacterium]